MGLKMVARAVCPPVLWAGVGKIKRRSSSPDERSSSCSIGRGSRLAAQVYQAESGRGTIAIGRDCAINGLLVMERDSAVLRIGDNVFANLYTIFDCAASITVEDDVSIAYHCFISDTNNHNLAYSVRKHDLRRSREGTSDWSTVRCAPVHICRGAWLGAHSMVLKGVRIGIGSIVGAGSVVTKDVPDWTVVAGNPARPIRVLSEQER